MAKRIEECSMHALPRHLLIFTRFPEPGLTKTRLIPALGEQGAADLQHAMTRHILAVAQTWARSPLDKVTVHFAGGDPQKMRAAFGDGFHFVPQSDGVLGERLHRAFQEAHNNGAQRIVAIGADCPDLSPEDLEHAFQELEREEVVIGPAQDGGYYLIALRAPRPELFENIAWGSAQVFRETLARIESCRMRAALLPEKQDIDEPEDLANRPDLLEKLQEVRGSRPLLSIVIPVLNEEAHIRETLACLGKVPAVESLVVDGGSTDNTVALARAAGAQVLQGARGRAVQMNAGARAASGQFLLFLHADTRLPSDYLAHVTSCLARPNAIAGAFRLAFDDTAPALRLIERVANLRTRLFQLPFGDQALFMRRDVFLEMNGFPDLPILEEVHLVDALRKKGRIVIAGAAVTTSARRWQQCGVFRVTLTHWAILLAWRLGVSPERLARWRL